MLKQLPTTPVRSAVTLPPKSSAMPAPFTPDLAKPPEGKNPSGFKPSGEPICDRLQRVRIQIYGVRGQSHFAAALGLTPSTYNYYEKGRVPRVPMIIKICDTFNVPMLWLIRGEPADFRVESLETRVTPARKPWGSIRVIKSAPDYHPPSAPAPVAVPQPQRHVDDSES